MSYDQALAQRVRELLGGEDVSERRMMGALCFMVGEHMCCGVTGPALMVRVGPGAYDATLAEAHVAPMLIGGRATTGFVLVDPAGVRAAGDLARWVQRALQFVSSLPPKPLSRARKRARA